MLFFALILILLQLCLASYLYVRPVGVVIPGVLGLLLLPVLAGFAVGSVAALLQSVVLACLIILLRIAQAPPRLFAATAIAASIAVFAYISRQSLVQIDELRHKYPIVDLRDRLAYETKHIASTSPKDAQPSRLSARSIERLARQEAVYAEGLQHWRIKQLRRLHADTVGEFIDSEGFGVTRMARFWHYPVRPDPIDVPTSTASSKSTSDETAFDPEEVSIEPLPILDKLYEETVSDFLRAETFGYIDGPLRAAEFVPHALFASGGRDPQMPHAYPELVSVLKHNPPGVYLSKHLPRMDELRDAPVRALDPFEGEGLKRLQEGEDLVVYETTREHRMLGAIRAASQCLNCHSVKRGTLLGAFSYDLKRDHPDKPPEDADEIPKENPPSL